MCSAVQGLKVRCDSDDDKIRDSPGDDWCSDLYIKKERNGIGLVWIWSDGGGDLFCHLNMANYFPPYPRRKSEKLQFTIFAFYSKVSLLSFCSSLFAPSFSTVTEILEANSGILSSQQWQMTMMFEWELFNPPCSSHPKIPTTIANCFVE